ncbi:TPA: hypothetical protein EYP12_07060 [Candidatus Bipolaricaulota bacterium]|nr:hypothetical protein [Candidatus Bipolaricaulota bacterium]
MGRLELEAQGLITLRDSGDLGTLPEEGQGRRFLIRTLTLSHQSRERGSVALHEEMGPVG